MIIRQLSGIFLFFFCYLKFCCTHNIRGLSVKYRDTSMLSSTHCSSQSKSGRKNDWPCMMLSGYKTWHSFQRLRYYSYLCNLPKQVKITPNVFETSSFAISLIYITWWNFSEKKYQQKLSLHVHLLVVNLWTFKVIWWFARRLNQHTHKILTSKWWRMLKMRSTKMGVSVFKRLK